MSQNPNTPRPFTSKRPRTAKYAEHQSQTVAVDVDYRPIRIRVYKNGDRFDPGTEIYVTRREFRHWLMLLDMITKRINSAQVVQKLYDLDGDEVTEFRELEDGGQYVAVGHERFKTKIKYGKQRSRTWQPPSKHPNHHDPTSVDSHESIEIYLKKLGFESQSGRQYPFDDPDKDPQTKAAIQKAALENAMQRQQVKEERANTRLTRYHSDGSLPRIEKTNHVVQRIDQVAQDPRNHSDPITRREQEGYRTRHHSSYGQRYNYETPEYRRYSPEDEWDRRHRSGYPQHRRRSNDDEYSDQGYSTDKQQHRRYSPPPPSTANRGRQFRRLADETGGYGAGLARPQTSKFNKDPHEVFDRLHRQRGSTARYRNLPIAVQHI